MSDETFICAECGGEFPFDREADEAAHAEAVENFGHRGDARGMAMVCDGCYRRIMAEVRSGDLETFPPFVGRRLQH